MEKRGIQLQMLPQELLHVDMDARVDIRDGQMKGINEKALVFTVFRYGFPDTSFLLITTQELLIRIKEIASYYKL